MSLPGYDAWKTHNPDDDRCEFCVAFRIDAMNERGIWRGPHLAYGCGHVIRESKGNPNAPKA